jgi:hypothetical protein
MQTVYNTPSGIINEERKMGFVSGLMKVVTGSVAGVAAVTALPVFGAVGTITAAGMAVGSVLGAAAGVADEINSKDKS